MTVAELIEKLQTFPQHLPVAYRCYSEQVLLKDDELKVREFCLPRPDGWVQSKRPDMPSQPYLLFPGN
jgi:hypothetical protein